MQQRCDVYELRNLRQALLTAASACVRAGASSERVRERHVSTPAAARTLRRLSGRGVVHLCVGGVQRRLPGQRRGDEQQHGGAHTLPQRPLFEKVLSRSRQRGHLRAG